jgi:SPP1 gp7 family putative phage head morphogenesis protein
MLLRAVISRLRFQTNQLLLPNIPYLIGEASRERKTDAWSDSLEKVMENLEVGFDAELDIESFRGAIREIGTQAEQWNSDQYAKMVKTVVGIEHFAYEPWMNSHLKSFISENVSLIAKLKGETLHDIRRIVESGLRKGDTYDSIRDAILDGTDLEAGRFSKTEARATLIARDQVGKFNGELTSIRQQSIGIKTYYWRTAGDERVRDSHDALDGMLCSWDDDTIYSDDNGETWQNRSTIEAFEGDPGEDYQCRCWGEAVFLEPEPEPEAEPEMDEEE